MNQELAILTTTAATLGLVHTVLGPDHYIPFVVLARARSWSTARTAVITFLCGVGHVASSVVLGAIGIAVGIAVAKLEWIEAVRGDVAAWLLTGFGFVYMMWGLYRAVRGRPHRHVHPHPGGHVHSHDHLHEADHRHPHEAEAQVNLTPWILFTVFVFGPCEPLIPLLMYPAASLSTWGVALVALVFGAATIATMEVLVLMLTHGARRLPGGHLERYGHAAAGAAILLCGVAIHLGL